MKGRLLLLLFRKSERGKSREYRGVPRGEVPRTTSESKENFDLGLA